MKLYLTINFVRISGYFALCSFALRSFVALLLVCPALPSESRFIGRRMVLFRFMELRPHVAEGLPKAIPAGTEADTISSIADTEHRDT
jgi:hypothetical protein